MVLRRTFQHEPFQRTLQRGKIFRPIHYNYLGTNALFPAVFWAPNCVRLCSKKQAIASIFCRIRENHGLLLLDLIRTAQKFCPFPYLHAPMYTPDLSLFDRRRRVGWTALVCVCMAVVGFATEGKDCVWAAAAMRIGFVLGALWLCFPTKTRPAAWAVLTQGRLVVLVIGALLWGRIKLALPFLAIAGIVLWFIRPRGKRG